MKTLRDLLRRGYFPSELPSGVDTASIGQIATPAAPAPLSFWSTTRTSQGCQHSVPRSGTLRRPLAIPNPVGYANLCREIDASWRAISTHLRKSSISKSIPHFYTDISRFYNSIYTHSIPLGASYEADCQAAATRLLALREPHRSRTS